MNFTDEQRDQFQQAAAPLMEFLGQHAHPHCTVIVDMSHAELLEGQLQAIAGYEAPPDVAREIV